MSIKEVEIPDRHSKSGEKILVRLVPQRLEERDFNGLLAKHTRPPYPDIFVEIVTQEDAKDKPMVVFRGDRRHEDIERAIHQEIGGKITSIGRGQLHLDDNTKKINLLRFPFMAVDNMKREEYTNLVFDAICPNVLSSPAVLVRYIDQVEFAYELGSRKAYPQDVL